MVEYDLKEVLDRIESKVDTALAEFRTVTSGLNDRVGIVERRMDTWDYISQDRLRGYEDMQRRLAALDAQKVGADAIEQHQIRLTSTRRWLLATFLTMIALAITVIGMVVGRVYT